MKLPDRVATIVIGNPLIADASVQAGGLMVITGKGYGMTNLIALDRAGAVLMEKSIEVRGPRADVVVVYRGVERESYSCTPNCERRITLGDSNAYFDATIGQTGIRNAPGAREARRRQSDRRVADSANDGKPRPSAVVSKALAAAPPLSAITTTIRQHLFAIAQPSAAVATR